MSAVAKKRARRVGRIGGPILLLVLIGVLLIVLDLTGRISLPRVVHGNGWPRVMSDAQYEDWARERFYRKFPGQKPLNWRIANTAERFHRERPMGKFVLHENDCSDFTDAILDEALGPKARFRRNSDAHIATNTLGLMKSFYWEPATTVIPGDIVTVVHSPWYPPKEPPKIAHIGVVGSDGHVYDFVKLKSWSSARYGRNSFEWFTRHCPDPDEVIITRLRPEYRYRINPLPFE